MLIKGYHIKRRQKFIVVFQTEQRYVTVLAKYHIYCERIKNENAIECFQCLKNKLQLERMGCNQITAESIAQTIYV